MVVFFAFFSKIFIKNSKKVVLYYILLYFFRKQ